MPTLDPAIAARLKRDAQGLVPAVVFGGCMTLVVAGITYLTAPKLKTLKLEVPEGPRDA